MQNMLGRWLHRITDSQLTSDKVTPVEPEDEVVDGAPPAPTQIIVWHPSELDDFSPGGLHMSSSLSSTRAGTRGVIYRTTADQGVVGVVDFASDATEHPDLGWTAYGVPQLLDEPITRAEMLADPLLRPVFAGIRGRRAVPTAASGRLDELVRHVPARRPAEPLPPASEVWHWAPRRADTAWINEDAMREAIRNDARSWRRLGFTSLPGRETHPARGTRTRTDLYQLGIIGECKVVMSGLDVLSQLDGYLAHAREEHPEVDWFGHIVLAAGYTQDLRRAVASREDITLWVCGRRANGRPSLDEVR
jgi:hypothetical protein